MRFAAILLVLTIPVAASARLVSGAACRPSIATLESIAGHKPGEEITINRAFTEATALLFMNAVLLSPGR